MLACYDRPGMPDHSDEWRRALGVLASSPEGATEALLFAHGLLYKAITGLVDSGLATSTIEPFLADGRIVEVMRFRKAALVGIRCFSLRRDPVVLS